jgi:uncharacterized protein involved in type VI secretion and phage assembly
VSIAMFDTMRRIVREELSRIRTAELAVVTEQHPHAADSDTDNYACSVQLRDTGLVLKRVPVAVHRVGAASLPGVGDLVLVQFVGGDLDAPIILGSLYNDEDRPPVNGDGKAVLHLPLGAADSDAAHIELSSNGTRTLKIAMGSTVVTITDDDPSVNIDVGDNAALTVGSNGAVTIKSSGNIEIKSDGNINVEAGATLTLKGATVNIN